MLVLSRKIGERLVIGDDIVVQVVEVSGGQIRLGIEAPRHIGVWREEVLSGREASAPEVVGPRKPR